MRIMVLESQIMEYNHLSLVLTSSDVFPLSWLLGAHKLKAIHWSFYNSIH